jgi:hypothetical protein
MRLVPHGGCTGVHTVLGFATRLWVVDRSLLCGFPSSTLGFVGHLTFLLCPVHFLRSVLRPSQGTTGIPAAVPLVFPPLPYLVGVRYSLRLPHREKGSWILPVL